MIKINKLRKIVAVLSVMAVEMLTVNTLSISVLADNNSSVAGNTAAINSSKQSASKKTPVKKPTSSKPAVPAKNAKGSTVNVVSVVDGNAISVQNGFKAKVFASGGSNRSNPENITYIGKNIFAGYGNGVKSNGDASEKGVHYSTIVEYNLKGEITNIWNIVGECSGLTADPSKNMLIATVNSASNSSMYYIYPSKNDDSQVVHISYSNADKTQFSGGTAGVSVKDGVIYVSASSPIPANDGTYSSPALYKVTVSGTQGVLTPVLHDNSKAIDAVSNENYTLNMADPDSNSVVPQTVPGFGKNLMLVDHSDAQLVFISEIGTSKQAQKRMSVGTQIKDAKFANTANGTLFVCDEEKNLIYQITGKFAPNTLFVSAPSDSGVAGFVGMVDIRTGIITPFAISLKSPVGMVFAQN